MTEDTDTQLNLDTELDQETTDFDEWMLSLPTRPFEEEEAA